MATYVREDDGSLRQLGAGEDLPDDALARGFFQTPDDDGPAAAAGPAEWPAGWVEVGATDDGIQDSLFYNRSSGAITVEHRERWSFTV